MATYNFNSLSNGQRSRSIQRGRACSSRDYAAHEVAAQGADTRITVNAGSSIGSPSCS